MDYPLVQPGMLEVFCGPMKSGKTRALLERVEKVKYTDRYDFVFIKPELDTRDDKIVSMSGERYDCYFVDETVPEKIMYLVKDQDIVVIDEAQFFGQGIELVIHGLLKDDKNVVIGGLDLDFRGEPFGMMPYLLAMADEVYKLTAVCEYGGCNKLATRTQRLVDGEPAKYNDPIILIGDKEEGYQARCLKHHEVPGRPSI